mmetsp:Transcript_210/g.484  ORF Transcript_210/g.484 Transcript_210/m.484 type:complete len:233 (-) Transcript_210:250-948(-)
MSVFIFLSFFSAAVTGVSTTGVPPLRGAFLTDAGGGLGSMPAASRRVSSSAAWMEVIDTGASPASASLASPLSFVASTSMTSSPFSAPSSSLPPPSAPGLGAVNFRMMARRHSCGSFVGSVPAESSPSAPSPPLAPAAADSSSGDDSRRQPTSHSASTTAQTTGSSLRLPRTSSGDCGSPSSSDGAFFVVGPSPRRRVEYHSRASPSKFPASSARDLASSSSLLRDSSSSSS